MAELGAAVGLSPDTVRYYERIGLLPPPARTPAGYRAYDAAAVDRLKFIQGAQRLGLRLRDIADLLDIRDTGVCPCEPAEQVLRWRLAEVDAEIARLGALRDQMAAMIEALPGAQCPPPDAGHLVPTRGREVNAWWRGRCATAIRSARTPTALAVADAGRRGRLRREVSGIDLNRPERR